MIRQLVSPEFREATVEVRNPWASCSVPLHSSAAISVFGQRELPRTPYGRISSSSALHDKPVHTPAVGYIEVAARRRAAASRLFG
jgi:hypothetical protein